MTRKDCLITNVGYKKARSRGDVLIRCFKLLKLFQDRRRISICDIAQELDITYNNARRYIEAASIELPIFQVEGEYPFQYEMMR